MIHRVIDNSVPDYVGGCALERILESRDWSITRSSNGNFKFKEYISNPNAEWEKPQPTIQVYDKVKQDRSEQMNYLRGYLECIFHHMCQSNGIQCKELLRVYANANYKDIQLESHTDSTRSEYQSIVLMLTPFMSETGLVVGDQFVPYQFCRSVWFDASAVHYPTPLRETHMLPRVTVAYMFEV